MIHIHNLQSMLWGYAAAMASKSERIVFTPHVINLPVPLLEKALYLALRLVKPFTSRIIALSHHQQEQLARNRAARRKTFESSRTGVDLAELAAGISSDPQEVRVVSTYPLML